MGKKNKMKKQPQREVLEAGDPRTEPDWDGECEVCGASPVVSRQGLVVCPVCHERGLKSTVQDCGSSATLMGYSSYYDEDGRRHNHNPNHITTSYVCSNDHVFSVTTRDRAGAGGRAGDKSEDSRETCAQ